MRNIFRKYAACIAFLSSLLLLGGTGLYLYSQFVSMQTTSSWESHTYKVLRGFDSVLSVLKDAETGQRGYIITGDRRYLEPYDSAVRAIPSRMAWIRTLTKDNKTQQQRIAALQLLTKEKLDELERTIDLRTTRGRDASSGVVMSDHGKNVMDSIRRIVAQAKVEEEHLLQVRTAQREASVKRVHQAIVVGATLGFAMLISAFFILKKELQRRTKAEAELEVQNGKLKELCVELQEETRERLEKERMLIQQSRMAAMGEMLNNIGHQWRQPLNVLGLTVQELLVMYDIGECNREYLEKRVTKAHDLVQQMSKNIEDLYAFSSPDKEKTSFSVVQVVEKTLSLVGPSLNENGVTVHAEIAEDVTIHGYPNEFAQVLINILLNARDAFKEQKSEGARVLLRSWAEDARAVVTITDNAGGIREEILHKIFDPYFTTKKLGKGSGIGLFLSKRIIEEKMGGRLSAYNIAGGAEFKIEV